MDLRKWDPYYYSTLIFLLSPQTVSTLLLLSTPSSEISAGSLCPSPLKETESSLRTLLPYRTFPSSINNNDNIVLFPDLKKNGSDCAFTFQGKGQGSILAVQRRWEPVVLRRECERVVQFGKFDQDWACSTTAAAADDALGPFGYDQESSLQTLLQTYSEIRWQKKKNLLTFDIPSVIRPADESSSPPSFLIVLFRVTSPQSGCTLLLQQYSVSSGCTSNDLLRDVFCGHFPCSLEYFLLQEMGAYNNDNKRGGVSFLSGLRGGSSYQEQGHGHVRGLGYFLKGLILPFLMSVMGTCSYFVWRRKLRALALEASGGPSTHTIIDEATTSMGEDEVLIHFEDDDDDDDLDRGGKDKPPEYEEVALLEEPPSYGEVFGSNKSHVVGLEGGLKGRGGGHSSQGGLEGVMKREAAVGSPDGDCDDDGLPI